MKIVTRVIVTAFALILVAEYIPGISISGVYPAIVAAIFLGIVNVLVRPILIVLTLPITILSLGLFIFLINATLFWFVASFVDGFSVSNFGASLLGSFIVSVVSSIINKWV